MTFSIVARCPVSGMFGVAISSSSPAVAARCAHARAGVGAVATQNVTDPSLGPLALDRMVAGDCASAVRDHLVATRPHIAFRQLTMVDASGRTASYAGANMLGINAVFEGDGAVTAGNDGVPAAMLTAFAHSSGALARRLLASLAAGAAAGGEAGPVHSAGLLVVDRVSWPIIDLRVDWADSDPIGALQQLWARYEPQVQAYIDRALDPTRAPRFGVPGDP